MSRLLSTQCAAAPPPLFSVDSHALYPAAGDARPPFRRPPRPAITNQGPRAPESLIQRARLFVLGAHPPFRQARAGCATGTERKGTKQVGSGGRDREMRGCAESDRAERRRLRTHVAQQGPGQQDSIARQWPARAVDQGPIRNSLTVGAPCAFRCKYYASRFIAFIDGDATHASPRAVRKLGLPAVSLVDLPSRSRTGSFTVGPLTFRQTRTLRTRMLVNFVRPTATITPCIDVHGRTRKAFGDSRCQLPPCHARTVTR